VVAAQAGERAREAVNVSRALDVDAERHVARDGEVVDGGEVEDAGRLGAGRGGVFGREAEALARDVALHDAEVPRGRAGGLGDARDVLVRARGQRGLDEQLEARARAREALDEAAGDEAGEAGQKNSLVGQHNRRDNLSEPARSRAVAYLMGVLRSTSSHLRGRFGSICPPGGRSG
jgi:hypothetical protein